MIMKKHLKNKIISLMKEILISYKEYKDGDPVFLIENEAEASSFSEKLRKDMLNTKTFLPQAKKMASRITRGSSYRNCGLGFS